MIKAVSSIALVVLGIAGWHLQSRTARTHDTTQQHEWQQRRYLPMLRSLAELEAELDTIEYWLRAHTGRWNDELLRELHHRGTAVRYAAYSVFTPAITVARGDVDPEIEVHQDITRTDLGTDPYIKLPLRSSALMLSDLIRMQLTLRKMPQATVQLDPATFSFVVRDGTRQPFRMRLARESVSAWKNWVGTKPVRAAKLVPDTVLVVLAQDLRVGIAQVTHLTIRTHPDLGEQYVKIRNEVLDNRAISSLNAASTATH